MDDIEKEKSLLQKDFEKQKKEFEKEMSAKFESLIQAKDNEIHKLSSELSKAQKIITS